MFDRGKAPRAASPPSSQSSPDKKTTTGSHMNNEQFGTCIHLSIYISISDII